MVGLLELEKAFVLEAWAQQLRPDKRLFQQLRDVVIEFPSDDRGMCVVKLGETMVAAVVACQLVEPSPFGGKNGFLEFRVKDALRDRRAPRSSHIAEISRMIETIIKDGQVIDIAALCVVPGRYVWSISVDVTILNDEGNAMDAALWSTVAALQHARRPEISINGDNVFVHPVTERDPIPLNLHHYPLCITCAITPQGDDVVVDPTVAELAASGGTILVAVNHELQVCDVHKRGQALVPYSVVKKCITAAKGLVPQLAQLMNSAMEQDEARRKEQMRAMFTWAKQRSGVAKAAPQ